ncbi:hypothetical protein BJ508DRAFT_320183 [Ascobolus immersus RN42]|uniref:Uncharacterized protein n=1 Tax=Ascobolus immersus RN42 TaxID=1160509 RepID=A0A3N4IQL3_ASCIM|nr:hypothetical protein BJ508DRAFT_320183 [Ascobolus immersus RN42]
MAVAAHLRRQALDRILTEAGIVMPEEDCAILAKTLPTFDQQAKEYEARVKDKEDHHARMKKYLFRRDVTVQEMCKAHGPWHKGVLRCRFDTSWPLNRLNPTRTQPRQRQVVELEYRLDFELNWRICVLSPHNSGHSRRLIYGWAINCPENGYPEDNILALRAGPGNGHRVRGYIVPGDSFIMKEDNPTAPPEVGSKEEAHSLLAPAADKWKQMRRRMAQLSSITTIDYVVHFKADCPPESDLEQRSI